MLTSQLSGSEHSASIHSNILQEIDNDPFRKYEVVQVLGEGSMGAVFKVQIRKSQVGGSAFRPKKQHGLMKLFRFLHIHDKHSRGPTMVSEHTDDFLFGLKRIMLDRISPAFIEELKNEISILRDLDHPNIVRPHEVYTQRKQIYLVMELCDGGDLYTRSPYTEKQAGRITSKFVVVVELDCCSRMYAHTRRFS